MALPEFSMRQLLEAGVHFGHQKHRWNPKMERHIFGVRNDIHILDLSQTVPALQRALQGRNGLAQVENVDVVADAEDVTFHLRVPAVLLVAKVNTCLEQLAHGKFRQCHGNGSFPVCASAGRATGLASHRMEPLRWGSSPNPRVNYAPIEARAGI